MKEHDENPPSSCDDCQLSRHAIYRPRVEDAATHSYAQRREICTTPTGRTFLREGEVPEGIFSLYSGWAISYRQLVDGRRQILSFLLPGDVIAQETLWFPGSPLPYSVKALTPATYCIFDARELCAALNGSEAQMVELRCRQQRYLTSLYGRLFDLGRRTARGRLAQLLLEIHNRLVQRGLVGEDGRFPFPPRQEHIADALGLTTVYVNRTLAHLRRDGIITADREYMTIHDEAELRRIAEEE